MRSDCNFVIGVSAAQPQRGVETEKIEWCSGHSCDRDEANIQRRNPSSYSCMRTLSITRKTIDKVLEQTGSLSSNTT